MGNQLTGPDKLHGTRIVGRLPQLSREEALHIRDQVLHDYGDLSRGLKVIIAERLCLLTRKRKAAQERLEKEKRTEVRAEIAEAEGDFHGWELALLVEPFPDSILAQIRIEREQAKIRKLVELFKDIL